MKAPLIALRETLEEDGQVLTKWFEEPGILEGFPMQNPREVEDSVRYWISHAVQKKTGVTALVKKEVAGMAVFYIQPFKKLAHTCLFSIVVGKKFRKMGIGSRLIKEIEKMAKDCYQIEILRLEVYIGNDSAIRLYENLGFKQYGVQKKFMKENGRYVDKILMEKRL